MPSFEYKVVPAPKKGLRSKGARSTEDKFANTLQSLMNELGADGWEYQRADTLPCEERSGLTGKTTAYQNMLIFRRALDQPDTSLLTLRKNDLSTDVASDEIPTTKKAPTPEEVRPQETMVTTPLGGASRSDPGKTVNAPEVAPQ